MKQITDRNVIDVEAKTPWGIQTARALIVLFASVAAWLVWAVVCGLGIIAVYLPFLVIGPWIGLDTNPQTLFSFSGIVMALHLLPALWWMMYTSDTVMMPISYRIESVLYRLLRLDPHLIASARRPGSERRSAAAGQPRPQDQRQSTLTRSPERLDGRKE